MLYSYILCVALIPFIFILPFLSDRRFAHHSCPVIGCWWVYQPMRTTLLSCLLSLQTDRPTTHCWNGQQLWLGSQLISFMKTFFILSLLDYFMNPQPCHAVDLRCVWCGVVWCDPHLTQQTADMEAVEGNTSLLTCWWWAQHTVSADWTIFL